jgi:hypothetical protein
MAVGGMIGNPPLVMRYLLASVGGCDETERPTFAAGLMVVVIVAIAVERSYRFGDVMTRVGYGKLGSMASPAREAAASIAGS